MSTKQFDEKYEYTAFRILRNGEWLRIDNEIVQDDSRYNFSQILEEGDEICEIVVETFRNILIVAKNDADFSQKPCPACGAVFAIAEGRYYIDCPHCDEALMVLDNGCLAKDDIPF